MRTFLIPAALFVAAVPHTAFAQDVEPIVESESSIDFSGKLELAIPYIDERFNERFSDRPIVKAEGSVGFGDSGFYVSGYVYSGFDDPLNDDSSEYGAAFGWEGEVSDDVTLNIEAGRYVNYQGGGFGAGDWYGLVGVTAGNASFSVSGLSGDTDTFVLTGAYVIGVADRFTLTPSAALITSTGAFNPGIVAEYELGDRYTLRGTIVAPETENGREMFAAVGVALNF